MGSQFLIKTWGMKMGFMQLQRGRSFIYKKALVWQEKGGQTWRVVDQVIRHPDGTVTSTIIAGGMPTRPEAKKLARSINCQR